MEIYPSSSGRLFSLAACFESLSQISFHSLPACPLIQQNLTVCCPHNLSSFDHRSGFTAFSFLFLLHPFIFQRRAHPFVMASAKYFESVYKFTAQGDFNASNPTMAAIISIRLFVVRRNPPDNCFWLQL